MEHLLRSGADPVIFCEIDPANGAAGIEQKFSGPSNGRLARPLRMQQIVVTDNLGLRIGQKRVSEALFLAVIAGDLGRVHADGYRSDAACRKVVQMLFDTPQLGVTGGSPVAAVENQQDPLGRGAIQWRSQEFREGYRFFASVKQAELRCLGADTWRIRGGWQLPGENEGKENKSAEDQHAYATQNGAKNFSLIDFRAAKGASGACCQERCAQREQKQVSPREVAREGKLHKKHEITEKGK